MYAAQLSAAASRKLPSMVEYVLNVDKSKRDDMGAGISEIIGQSKAQ